MRSVKVELSVRLRGGTLEWRWAKYTYHQNPGNFARLTPEVNAMSEWKALN